MEGVLLLGRYEEEEFEKQMVLTMKESVCVFIGLEGVEDEDYLEELKSRARELWNERWPRKYKEILIKINHQEVFRSNNFPPRGNKV